MPMRHILAGAATSGEQTVMPLQQKIFFGLVALAFLVLVVELVRRRKLAEEYTLLWTAAAVIIGLLVLKFDILLWLTRLTGAVQPTSALLFFGLFFCLLVILHLSVRLSRCAKEIRNLGQDVALLRKQTEERKD